jgi:hypothetical protein
MMHASIKAVLKQHRWPAVNVIKSLQVPDVVEEIILSGVVEGNVHRKKVLKNGSERISIDNYGSRLHLPIGFMELTTIGKPLEMKNTGYKPIIKAVTHQLDTLNVTFSEISTQQANCDRIILCLKLTWHSVLDWVVTSNNLKIHGSQWVFQNPRAIGSMT